MTSIQAYFREKTVLITGATGFVGSVLLQTLLAKLPEVQTIYCLQRAKPGCDGTDDPRVVWIQGDVMLPDWGLSGATLARIEQEVQVIFHLAAYTRWDLGIEDQVRANTIPVLYGAQLASRCARLESLVVTSSYWAACHLSDAAPIPEQVFADAGTEDELMAILGGGDGRLAAWPNAYAYAKNLAERLLQQQFPELPIVIARVTSVCGAWSFPERGHCRFDNAMPALLRAIAQGGVRIFPAAMRSAINDCIPVDLCANLLLASAVERANTRLSLVHCASAHRNPMHLADVAELGGSIQYVEDAELEAALCALANENPRAAALNRTVLAAYGFAMGTRYVFVDDEARRPLAWMSDEERALFPIDVDALDWPLLFRSMLARLPQPRARTNAPSETAALREDPREQAC